MSLTTTDIIIAGGGIAGMTAASRFAAEGFAVTLVDPAETPAQCPRTDLRPTAF